MSAEEKDDRSGAHVAPPQAGHRREERTELDRRVLEVLVCPATRGPLSYDREKGELVPEGATLAYPIRNGIPVLLVGEARKLDD